MLLAPIRFLRRALDLSDTTDDEPGEACMRSGSVAGAGPKPGTPHGVDDDAAGRRNVKR